MTADEVMEDAMERMDKSVEYLTKEFRGMRTGQAHPGLVEGIRVEYYGSPTPLKQLANIMSPEPSQLVIKPFDPTSLSEMEKAIQKSDLGINPQSDGKILRLIIPPLSEERRKKLVKRAKDVAEEARTSIRNIRRDANKAIDALEKTKELSEDEAKKLKSDIQDLTNDSEGKVNELVKSKTSELMEI